MSLKTSFNLTSPVDESTAVALPYIFVSESVIGCANEMVHEVLSEAANFQEFSVSADELIAEATMTNNPRLDVLVESVLESVKTTAINFYEKCKRMALAIVAKLKELAYRMTGQTGKWAEAMKAKGDAAGNKPGFTAECYNWDTKFVAKDMPAILDKFNNMWQAQLKKYAWSQVREVYGRALKTTATGDSSTAGAMAQLNDLAEKVKADIDQLQANAHTIMGEAFGVRGNNADDVWNAVVIKAHGGNDRAQRQIGASAGAMLNAVAQSGSWIKAIQQAYELHASELEKYRRDIETNLNGSGEGGANVQAATDYARAVLNYSIKCTQVYEAAMAKTNALNVKLIQDMTREYMNILTSYCSTKKSVQAPAQA